MIYIILYCVVHTPKHMSGHVHDIYKFCADNKLLENVEYFTVLHTTAKFNLIFLRDIFFGCRCLCVFWIFWRCNLIVNVCINRCDVCKCATQNFSHYQLRHVCARIVNLFLPAWKTFALSRIYARIFNMRSLQKV